MNVRKERPLPPLSAGDPNSQESLLYRLGMQARKDKEKESPTQNALRRTIRDQSSGHPTEPSDYIERLLTSLNNGDITLELFEYALGLPQYAPTAENDALRPEDEEPSE